MLTIERHQQDEWCLWFSCYVHYSKIYQILEGSFRDFLDSVSAKKSEKKAIKLTLVLFIQPVNNETS